MHRNLTLLPTLLAAVFIMRVRPVRAAGRDPLLAPLTADVVRRDRDPPAGMVTPAPEPPVHPQHLLREEKRALGSEFMGFYSWSGYCKMSTRCLPPEDIHH